LIRLLDEAGRKPTGAEKMVRLVEVFLRKNLEAQHSRDCLVTFSSTTEWWPRSSMARK
jgi:hypothetical protein